VLSWKSSLTVTSVAKAIGNGYISKPTINNLRNVCIFLIFAPAVAVIIS